MASTPSRSWLSYILLLFAVCAAGAPANITELKRAFQDPPDDARIMMRWWWFGPAVTKPEIEREMRVMKEGGIGGFEVQPVYPVVLDDPQAGYRNLPYLSDEFLDVLRFTGEKARELGLRMDLTLGSGWPFGGPHVPITQAAGRLRVDRGPTQPYIGEGEKLIAVEGGRFFVASRTGQTVKRPAVGAEGFVLDHYDRAAIENHLRVVGERLMQALGKNPPHAVFSDSLEVFGSDWTGDFPEEFQKRRGYDLKPYLPALVEDIGEKTGAVRNDWAKTLTELADERYLTPIREWAQRHGTLFRSQTYGAPPVTLSSNALVDLPEGEREHFGIRWASSASHLYGNPVTSSETWTWLHSPVFRATPLDMKAEADLHFLAGINQLVGHGWPYSPPSAGEPGWRFYAAAVFNQHNPWWIVMPDITRYLQRVSYILRQGKPVNDIALYVPTADVRARFVAGRELSINRSMEALLGPDVIPQILNAGYNFDFIDDEAIERVGIPYPVLILPGVERIPLGTLQRIEAFARRGGIVLATRRLPALAPGLMEAEKDTPKIRELSQALFKTAVEEKKLGSILDRLLPADVATSPEIGFVHRKVDFADIYFLANTSNHAVHAQAAFRVTGLAPAWWDPFSGTVTKAGRGAKIELDLAPYESRVLVFSKDQQADAPARTSAAPVELSTGWRVTFPNSPDPVMMRELRSWTEDERAKFFSGSATYERSVNIPGPISHPLYLNFGEGTPVDPSTQRRPPNGMRAWLESPVREAGMVYVNGQFAGYVWHPPYEVDVSALLHAGENSIRVIVANLAINEMARDPLPDYRLLKSRYGDRFQPQDLVNLEPLPAGMLGPVRLVSK